MDPERPIEKGLREYAARRREQQCAPPDLHPATRRLLHGEIRRTYASTRGSASARGWFRTMPKYAWGGLALMLAGLIWVLAPESPRQRSSERPTELALTRTAAPESPGFPANVAEPASAPVDVAFKQEALSAGRRRSDRSVGIGDASTSTARSASPSAGVPASAPATRSLAAPRPEADTTVALRTDNVQAPQNVSTMMFLNQAPAVVSNRSATQNKAAILVNFQVHQEGDRVRILDSDGSVYSGAARPLTLTAAVQTEPLTRERAFRQTVTGSSLATAPGPESAAGAEQNYSFEVVGTNLTLQQRVVFNGLLLEGNAAALSTNAIANIGIRVWDNARFQNLSNSQNLSGAAQIQFPAANRRISGKAIIGTSQEVPVEAIPAP